MVDVRKVPPGPPFEIRRWTDASLAAMPNKTRPENERRCDCIIVADCIEGAVPVLRPCAACLLAGMINELQP